MSLNVSETKQSFPFAYEPVFDGLVAILGPAGFTIASQDRVIGRIVASAGMSGFSWGENVTIQIERRGEATTALLIQSNLKVGFNVTATGKNAKNAERLIGALSNYLQTGGRDVAQSVAAAPSASSSPVLWVLAFVIGAGAFLWIVSQ
jgi:hypothetical protein